MNHAAFVWMFASMIMVVVLGASACRPRPVDTPPTGAKAAAEASADRDGDGVPDHLDRCPDEPEDCDGFEDDDGCPDLDDDRDGIPDTCDVCPLAKETWNGWGDADGCPDSSADMHRYRSDPPVAFFDPIAILECAPNQAAASTLEALDHAARQLKVEGDRVSAIVCVGLATKSEGAALARARAAGACDGLIARGVAASLIEGRHGLVDRSPVHRPAFRPSGDQRVFIYVTRAAGLVIWRWTNDGLEWASPPGATYPEPGPKDPRCAEGAPRPAPPPPGGCIRTKALPK